MLKNRLVLAATERELQAVMRPFQAHIVLNKGPFRIMKARGHEEEFVFCATGIGTARSSMAASFLLSQFYIVNVTLVGFAGALFEKLNCQPGEPVVARSERFLHLGGFDTNGNYEDLSQRFSLSATRDLKNSFSLHLPADQGWKICDFGTSDFVSSRKEDLDFMNRYHPEVCVESMEGASVAMVCQEFEVPFSQIRCITNQLGDRNHQNWSFEEAIASLEGIGSRLIQGHL